MQNNAPDSGKRKNLAKPLIALSVIQTVALLFLGTQILKINARTDEIAKDAADAKVSAAIAAKAQSTRSDFTARVDGGITSPESDQIREIFRQEFAAAVQQLPAGSTLAPSRNPTPIASAETNQLRDTLLQRIDSYVASGKIGDREMADLQMQMANLPPEQRRDLLKRITRAMNSGQLEARL